MHVFDEIGTRRQGRRAGSTNALAEKRKIMGFGHRVYKNGDSRVPTMKAALDTLVEEYDAQDLLRSTTRSRRRWSSAKDIKPNLDYPSGPGVPPDRLRHRDVHAAVRRLARHRLDGARHRAARGQRPHPTAVGVRRPRRASRARRSSDSAQARVLRPGMSRIVAVAPALPEYAYTQAEITAELSDLITSDATAPRRARALPRRERHRHAGTPCCRSSGTATSATSARQRHLDPGGHRARRARGRGRPRDGRARARRRRLSAVHVGDRHRRPVDRRPARPGARAARRREADAVVRPRLRRRRGRARSRARLPARPSGRDRPAGLGRALLADAAARRRLGGQLRRERAVRRRSGRGRHRRRPRAPPSSACPAPRSSAPAASSTPTARASSAGTSAAPGSASC